MLTIEKRKERIKEWIDNIEQLGADARYHYDYENYDKLKTQFDSIAWWSKKANKELIKIQVLENAKKLEEQENE